MDISKIEAGRIEIERREINFPEFLEQIVGMFQLQASAKNLAFTFRYPQNLPARVFTDETRLRQILINLLSNALKFTERGKIGFLVRLPGEVMEFEISDSGPGIAPENFSRIFEPFERVTAHGPAIQGIGLGLTITKLLVEIMGGQITVTSTKNVGSIFRVQLRLPAAAHSVAFQPHHRALLGYAGPVRTIIVAEDNATHRMLLEDALAPAGFRLLCAPDGASCLRLAADCPADLFLLDISMPAIGGAELDGIEVARRLRAAGHATTPIVMLSAHAPDLRSHTAVYDAIMAKPLDLRKLLELIGRLLQLDWRYGPELLRLTTTPEDKTAARQAIQPYIAQLRYLAGIGFIRGLKETLTRIAAETPAAAPVAENLLELTAALALPDIIRSLDELDMHAH
jgi:CheY-like chemotaxis protein